MHSKISFLTAAILVHLLCVTSMAWTVPSDSTRGTDVCPNFHMGTTQDLPPGSTVKICDQFYDDAPLVRLSDKDDYSNPDQVIFSGAIDSLFPEGAVISDRNGQKFFVLNSKGEVNPVYDYSALPSTIQMPSQMYLYVIYKFQGKIAPIPSSVPPSVAPGTKGLIISTATPIVYIPGSLLDGYLLGNWEGSVTLRITPTPPPPKFAFDPNSTKPLRIKVTTVKPLQEPLASQVLGVWPDAEHQGQKLKDVTISDAMGTVANFNADVLGSDGSCIPSLASFNDQNPFLGASSGAVDFYRYPGMHGAGSEAFVMVFPPATQSLAPTGMSVPFFMKASTLVLSNPQFVANELPHSLHNGFRIGGLHKVTGGGGSCP